MSIVKLGKKSIDDLFDKDGMISQDAFKAISDELREGQVPFSAHAIYQHLWLYGMQKIIEGNILLLEETDEYIAKEKEKFPPFQDRISMPSYNRLVEQRLGEIRYKSLPIDENYHLTFPLVMKGAIYVIVYDKNCQSCEFLEMMSPDIVINSSILPGKDLRFYETRQSMHQQPRIMWEKSWNTFKEFVENVRNK